MLDGLTYVDGLMALSVAVAAAALAMVIVEAFVDR